MSFISILHNKIIYFCRQIPMPLVPHNISNYAAVPWWFPARPDRKRGLQNIQADHDQFVADGSCTSRQKFYHNVLHQKLLDIELDKVIIICLLWQHTKNVRCFSQIFSLNTIKQYYYLFTGLCSWTPHLLGVFKKLFDELENQCFELDQKIQI